MLTFCAIKINNDLECTQVLSHSTRTFVLSYFTHAQTCYLYSMCLSARRTTKTSKNAFKEKIKEIQTNVEEAESETQESGFASPADEQQPSPRSEHAQLQ